MSATDEKDSKKIDYLEVDDVIAGQNYVCLSFLSPESLIQDKAAFKCVKFLQSYCKDSKLKFDEVYSQYLDFTYKHEEKLQRDFDEQNDFQTSLRGIKVRGVFDTREAAQQKAKKLSQKDSAFHTFVGQMGYWLPWDPNPDKVGEEVFQDGRLNDMMGKYQENSVNRDMFYDEQKREKIAASMEEVREAKERNSQAALTQEGGTTHPENSTAEDYPIDPVEEDETPDSSVRKGSEVSDDIKDSLESDDPWIQRQRSQSGATDSVVDSVTDSVADSVVDSVVDSVADSVSDSVAEVSANDSVAEVSDSVAEVSDSVAEVSDSAVDIVADGLP